VLDFLVRAFAGDVVQQNGQPFLFLPRPARPAFLIGGAPPHALARAARFGDGWMPIGQKPADLAPHVARLRELFAAAGKPAPELAVLTRLPLHDVPRAADLARAYAELGATRLVHSNRYADAAAFAREVEAIAARIRPSLG
jgi:alkanesulfonate monooxygenase SsuD/methylene tetrahydromethanopterin reductase-like flavin-dependent oxidoreductase (luciferase family)